MRILAIGDFHGNFPRWIPKLIKKEKIDIVVSNGDYFPFHYRKLWFKHCYGKDTELWEVIGKSKYKKLVLKDLKDGGKAIRELNKVKVPIITIFGNLDYTRSGSDNSDYKHPGGEKSWEWDNQDFFSPIIKKYKNIKRFDYKFYRFKDYVFIGAYGSTNRGDVSSKTYKRYKKKLDKLFRKFKKENKNRKVIFVSHNVPYNTKLDKVSKKAHKAVAGKHVGSKMIRSIINIYQPVVHIGGHVHEAKGKDMIKKTTAVNPGAAHDGQAAVIDISDKGKVKVRFIE